MRHDYVATGYVFSPKRDKTLLIFHRKMRKWLPPGGHLQPNELPHEGAIREVWEETGIRAKPIPWWEELDIKEKVESQLPTPFCMLHEYIPASQHDEAHMHIDFIFLLEPENEAPLSIAPKEVEEARWMSLEEVCRCDTFDSVIQICRKVMGGQFLPRGNL
mgnify:CR=1 FL=1